MIAFGFTEQSWLIRTTLGECADYDCAHKKLAHTPVNALGYFTLAGTKGDEGVVISRNNWGPANERYLSEADGTWYLVQTNNDAWKPMLGDSSITRYKAAVKSLEALGQEKANNVTLRDDVLLVYPVLNKETLYNTDFTPITGFINTLPEDVKADRKSVV